VCAGLLSERSDHAARVDSFGRWLLRVPKDASTFATRVAASSGELFGGLLGDTSQRYAVGGPAFNAARRALPSVAAGTMVTCAGDEIAPAGSVTPESRQLAETVSQEQLTEVKTAATAAAPELSPIFLSFDDDGDSEGMAQFVAAQSELTRRSTAAIPVAVFVAYLAAVLLELAADDSRRHHPHPLPLAGLAAAVLLSAAVLCLRVAAVAVPPAADAALVALGLLAGSAASAALTRCVAVENFKLMMLLGFPELFPQLPWLAQAALQFVAILLPALYDPLYVHPRAITTWLLITAVFVVVRYHTRRARCQHYVAFLAAHRALVAAADKAEAYAALLAGVLPPHAVAVAGSSAGALHAGDRGWREHVRIAWDGLSVLQLVLRVGDACGMEQLADVWRYAAGTVADVGGGLLEGMESSGDGLLVAGPFDGRGDDGTRSGAAVRAVLLARALRVVVAPYCSFTAVATTGSAYGALVGMAGMTFRLFGPAVRESNALLAAAPLTEEPAAFVTEGFRRQHANFGMDLAFDDVEREVGDAALSRAIRGAAERDADPFQTGAATEDFGAAATWRMRGVGVARVSHLRLTDSN
jgi:hypothetical protein